MRRNEKIKQLWIGIVCLLFMNFFVINMISGRSILSENKRLAVTSNYIIKEKQKISENKIAITFDDGPHPVYTEKLLDGLKKRGVKATFFITGKNAETYPQIVKREQDEGHLIGNHTYSHMQLTASNRKKFKEELQKTNVIITGITGQEVSFVRPPFGCWDKSLEDELNMFPVLWTIDPLDWCRDDAECITRNVIAKTGDNSIILMHDQYESSVMAAFQIIDELQKKGYAFVTVEEILFD